MSTKCLVTTAHYQTNDVYKRNIKYNDVPLVGQRIFLKHVSSVPVFGTIEKVVKTITHAEDTPKYDVYVSPDVTFSNEQKADSETRSTPDHKAEYGLITVHYMFGPNVLFTNHAHLPHEGSSFAYKEAVYTVLTVRQRGAESVYDVHVNRLDMKCTPPSNTFSQPPYAAPQVGHPVPGWPSPMWPGLPYPRLNPLSDRFNPFSLKDPTKDTAPTESSVNTDEYAAAMQVIMEQNQDLRKLIDFQTSKIMDLTSVVSKIVDTLENKTSIISKLEELQSVVQDVKLSKGTLGIAVPPQSGKTPTPQSVQSVVKAAPLPTSRRPRKRVKKGTAIPDHHFGPGENY